MSSTKRTIRFVAHTNTASASNSALMNWPLPSLKCSEFFDDNELMSVFVGGLIDDIRRYIQHYWSTH